MTILYGIVRHGKICRLTTTEGHRPEYGVVFLDATSEHILAMESKEVVQGWISEPSREHIFAMAVKD